MKSAAKWTNGFTLVEIMIVITIIGLLAGIALPAWFRARTTANASTCVGQLRQIEQATQDWALECKKGENSAVEYSDIQPYLKGRVICPAGGSSFTDSYQVTTVSERPQCLQVTNGNHPHVLPGGGGSSSGGSLLGRP
jgi:prepilin-type N-terminal cleavage/methylation domain-containing protein